MKTKDGEPNYDIYYHNEIKATFYTNHDTRKFIQELVNDGADWEAFAVIKDGHALSIDVRHEVSIGGM